jgi:hypothetical protein
MDQETGKEAKAHKGCRVIDRLFKKNPMLDNDKR